MPNTTVNPRQAEAYRLRQQGLSYAQVAAQAGYANGGAARHAVLAHTAALNGGTYNRGTRRQATRTARGTEITWGVEFEVEGLGQQGACRAVEVALGLTPGTLHPAAYHAGQSNGWRGWTVERDGSLGQGGAECVSPILTGLGGLTEAANVITALRAAGATTSGRCGQHVHLSVRHLSDEQLDTFFDWWAAGAAAINALLPAGRRDASYSRTFLAHHADRAKLVRRGQVHPTHTERYLALNVQHLLRRGTVEVRCQEGHTSAARLRTWVRFLLAAVAAAEAGTLRVTTTSSVRRLLSGLDLPDATRSALLRRAGETAAHAAA